MPRKPSVITPLRRVREAAGLTQQQLADRIGVAKDTVEKTENNRLKISHDTAVKIRHQLGCSLGIKTDKTTGRKVWNVSTKKLRNDGSWTNYTAEDYASHKELLDEISTEKDGDWEDALAGAVTLVVEAARKARRLHAAGVAMECAIAGLIDSFKLESHVAAVLRDEYDLAPDEAKMVAHRLAVVPARTGLKVSGRASTPPPAAEPAPAAAPSLSPPKKKSAAGKKAAKR